MNIYVVWLANLFNNPYFSLHVFYSHFKIETTYSVDFVWTFTGYNKMLEPKTYTVMCNGNYIKIKTDKYFTAKMSTFKV